MSNMKKKTMSKSVYKTGYTYPVPSNLTYSWNFGVSAGMLLFSQMVTGIFLAMHYVPDGDLAFDSVRHMVLDVKNGFMMSSLHTNGSSLFFFMTYMHMFRGLYYNSYIYPSSGTWMLGVIILLLMIITAFLGYVLPWGQMSYWAATVITNMMAVIPVMGDDFLMMVWGDYSVSNATLQRFFALHFFLPFVILAFVGLHIISLHESGSTNPTVSNEYGDKVSFKPYYVFKDTFTTMFLLFSFNFYCMEYAPSILDPDNYIKANPLSTPPHMVPEWYFKMFYAMLRSVPNKEFGAFLLMSSIVVLFIFPFLTKPGVKDPSLSFGHSFFFWLFFTDFWLLTWLGGQPMEEPYVLLGQVCTGYYFLYFLVMMPFLNYFESRSLKI